MGLKCPKCGTKNPNHFIKSEWGKQEMQCCRCGYTGCKCKFEEGS